MLSISILQNPIFKIVYKSRQKFRAKLYEMVEARFHFSIKIVAIFSEKISIIDTNLVNSIFKN